MRAEPENIVTAADARMEAPVIFDMTYYAKRGDGKILSTKIRFPLGQIPTQHEIDAQIAYQLLEMQAGNMRHLTKAEFFAYISLVRFGAFASMPGSTEWEPRV